jgi:hypothetical protein
MRTLAGILSLLLTLSLAPARAIANSGVLRIAGVVDVSAEIHFDGIRGTWTIVRSGSPSIQAKELAVKTGPSIVQITAP